MRLCERLVPSLQLTEDDFYAVIDTNLKGVCFCCKYAIPYMKQVGEGAIITVSSRAAFMPTNIAPIYCASKAAALSCDPSHRSRTRQRQHPRQHGYSQ